MSAHIVIRSIEATRTPLPALTPERRTEQIAKLAAAGIRVPRDAALGGGEQQ